MEYIKKSKIDNVKKECLEYLRTTQRHKDGYYGWHQHLGTNKLGIVATSMALLSYKMMDNVSNCPNYSNCLRYISNKRKSDNGWSYISNSGSVSNVEATCWAIQALLIQGPKYKDIISNAVKWILSQHTTNNITDGDAGWAYISGAEQKVYVTCLAIKTLSLAKAVVIENLQSQIDTKVISAINWIKSIQKDNKGWGDSEKSDANLFHTSYVIPILIDYGNVKNTDPIIENAVNYIQTQLASNNYSSSRYECLIEFIEYNIIEKSQINVDSQRIRLIFFHDVLQYALIALIKSGKDCDTIYWGIKYLCTKYRSGKVEHPLMENSKIFPIWPIYDTLLVFNEYITSHNINWNNVKIVFPCFINRKTYIGKKFNPLSYILIVPNCLYHFVAIVILCCFLGKYKILSIFASWLSDFLNQGSDSNMSSIICNLIASILIIILTSMFKTILKNKKDV